MRNNYLFYNLQQTMMIPSSVNHHNVSTSVSPIVLYLPPESHSAEVITGNVFIDNEPGPGLAMDGHQVR